MKIDVTISGIGKKPELNGKQGVILRRANKPNRFGVQVEGNMLSLHIRNLNLLLPLSYVSPIEVDKLASRESELFANLLAEDSNLLNVPTICYGRTDYRHMDAYFLIDCYRLRVQDDNNSNFKHGWYDRRCSHSTPMRARVIVADFLLFIKCAHEKPDIFPASYNGNPSAIWQGALYYAQGRTSDPWPMKDYSARYGDNMVSALRFLGEKIYGSTPGGACMELYEQFAAEVNEWTCSENMCVESPNIFTSVVDDIEAWQALLVDLGGQAKTSKNVSKKKDKQAKYSNDYARFEDIDCSSDEEPQPANDDFFGQFGLNDLPKDPKVDVKHWKRSTGPNVSKAYSELPSRKDADKILQASIVGYLSFISTGLMSHIMDDVTEMNSMDPDFDKTIPIENLGYGRYKVTVSGPGAYSYEEHFKNRHDTTDFVTEFCLRLQSYGCRDLRDLICKDPDLYWSMVVNYRLHGTCFTDVNFSNLLGLVDENEARKTTKKFNDEFLQAVSSFRMQFEDRF